MEHSLLIREAPFQSAVSLLLPNQSGAQEVFCYVLQPDGEHCAVLVSGIFYALCVFLPPPLFTLRVNP